MVGNSEMGRSGLLGVAKDRAGGARADHRSNHGLPTGNGPGWTVRRGLLCFEARCGNWFRGAVRGLSDVVLAAGREGRHKDGLRASYEPEGLQKGQAQQDPKGGLPRADSGSGRPRSRPSERGAIEGSDVIRIRLAKGLKWF